MKLSQEVVKQQSARIQALEREITNLKRILRTANDEKRQAELRAFLATRIRGGGSVPRMEVPTI